MSGEILYQGHASVRIKTKDGHVIYVDPYAGQGYDEPADLILVTHQHFDHTAVDKPPKKNNTEIIDNYKAQQNGVYNSFDIDGIKIKAVEAYNKNHMKENCVGYLIDDNGTKIYISGDTGLTEQMPELASENIDYAFLPIDGIFTMSPQQAAQCAEIINAKYTIPYHSDPGSDFDENQANKFNTKSKQILRPGETLNYD